MKPHPGTRVIFLPKSQIKKKILSHPELTNPTPSTSKQIQSKIVPVSKTQVRGISAASQNKNIEFDFHFKFTYATRFKQSYVFAKSNHRTEYHCIFCASLEILDYETFKNHIETEHLKQPIAYSVCDSCLKFENIDEFEYHIMQQHLRDNINIFSFKLLALDKDIKEDNSMSCFSFVCKTLDFNKAGRIEVNASPSWKFVCENCQCQFRKISQLQSHLENVHIVKLSQLACNKCGILFKSFIELPKHVLSQHFHHLNIVVFMTLLAPDPKKIIKILPNTLKLVPLTGSPTPNLTDTVEAVVPKPVVLSPVIAIPVTKTTNEISEINQPKPVVLSPVKVTHLTKTTNKISKMNQPTLKRKDETTGAPPAKQPRKEHPVFVLSYDIDSENDHCVIARSSVISDAFLCCRLCQVKFKLLSHLVMHIESSHIHDKISYCICEKCCTVLYSLEDLPRHIQTLHSETSKTGRFQFKLISMKTTVLEDIEEGLSMEELLPPPANYQKDEGKI